MVFYLLPVVSAKVRLCGIYNIYILLSLKLEFHEHYLLCVWAGKIYSGSLVSNLRIYYITNFKSCHYGRNLTTILLDTLKFIILSNNRKSIGKEQFFLLYSISPLV